MLFYHCQILLAQTRTCPVSIEIESVQILMVPECSCVYKPCFRRRPSRKEMIMTQSSGRHLAVLLTSVGCVQHVLSQNIFVTRNTALYSLNPDTGYLPPLQLCCQIQLDSYKSGHKLDLQLRDITQKGRVIPGLTYFAVFGIQSRPLEITQLHVSFIQQPILIAFRKIKTKNCWEKHLKKHQKQGG